MNFWKERTQTKTAAKEFTLVALFAAIFEAVIIGLFQPLGFALPHSPIYFIAMFSTILVTTIGVSKIYGRKIKGAIMSAVLGSSFFTLCQSIIRPELIGMNGEYILTIVPPIMDAPTSIVLWGTHTIVILAAFPLAMAVAKKMKR